MQHFVSAVDTRYIVSGFRRSDANQQHSPDDCELQLVRNLEQHNEVVEDLHDSRADDHSDDGTLTTAETASSQHCRRDGVELKKVAIA